MDVSHTRNHIQAKICQESTAYREAEHQTWIRTIAKIPAQCAPLAKQTFGQTCNAAMTKETILLVIQSSWFQIGWNANSFA